MASSSESDSYDRARGNRARGRDAQRRHGRDSRRVNGSVPEAAISEKISDLASTLQDTSRNLNKVDQMLGQYRGHTDDQAEAMALLRENLEESISQLQAQRLRRSNGARSASASTLHTSDLETGSGSEGPRFYPTSPLKDYTGPPGRRRRSQSATVRFTDTSLAGEDIHSMHQSLRDLQSNQQRLSDDLDREILRRNRSDIDTRRAMENLTDYLTPSPKQALAVESRVEQHLQELEREVHSEWQSDERARRPRQRVAMSDDLQEAVRTPQAHGQERVENIRARLLKSEREKTKTEQELEKARGLLEQSENNRDSLLQQVEDMRGELLRTEKEKLELQGAHLDLQREVSQLSVLPYAQHMNREDRGGRGGPERSDLVKEVAELRAQLSKASILSEVDDLRRALERKERERVQLCTQVEELSSDLASREQQQLRILAQLKEMQGRGQEERKEAEALLQESMRSKDELKTRAQDAVRQWRAKCRRLQKELEEMKAQTQLHSDKARQATKEKESSQTQLKALSLQTEAVHRELTDVLSRLAQREEELHRKDMELSETRQRHLSIEREIQEVRLASAVLEEEAQRHTVIQAQLREENQRLDKQAAKQTHCSQKDQAAQAELQATLKELTSARAKLAQQLSEEESSRKELQRGMSELRARLTAAQEERASLGQQLQLEREVHQKELDSLRAMVEDSKAKRDHGLQETLRLCRKERDEMQAYIQEVKVDAASDRELCRALRVKLEKMKEECDKLMEELRTKEEAHTLLQRMYQQLKQELDDKVRSGYEWKRGSEVESIMLQEQVSRLEAEQETVLSSVGEELDAVCRSLARGGEDKLQAISQKPELVKDPHRWLAETKLKLRWLCEEVRERETRELRLRKQHQQTRDELKALTQSWDSDQDMMLQRLDQQEKLLHSLSTEKTELLKRSRRKEETMRSLQDRVLDLEMSTKVALDHLESMPEKLSLMENFKDLEESQRQNEIMQQRYTKSKEIVWDLQHKLDESKRRTQEYKDEKLDATSRSLKLAALSSSIKSQSTFLSSSLMSDTLSSHKHHGSLELDVSLVNGGKTFTDHLN
ncbi:centrosomal protein of 128 kDa [Lampris incognitus]|uniref:centrosomal protein of 128 kDa n=1 Tax=Lampris incognitus TaxID=2546036 RepID=UPI0024B4C400|nr:centrosomal protein of 128 kDa [Lampris incognitus]